MSWGEFWFLIFVLVAVLAFVAMTLLGLTYLSLQP